jgi:N-acetylmuramoyl-L-alanine amidase
VLVHDCTPLKPFNIMCACLPAIVIAGVWSWCALAADIAIDVGHSRSQPGAMSARGVPEFRFNLDLALQVDRELRNALFETLLVGAEGEMGELPERTRLAAGATFFLSIHHDSVQPQYLEWWMHEGIERPYSDRFRGFSLFVSRKNAQLGMSLRCASEIGAQLRRRGFEPSLYHVDPILGENRPFADRSNGVHYFDDLVVLGSARSPAVLLEAGVIVNRDEELALSQPETRAQIARAVSAGLSACLRPVPAPK